MTPPEGSRLDPITSLSPILALNPLDFGGRLELGGTAVEVEKLLVRTRTLAETHTKSTLIRAEMNRFYETFAERHAAIARRIEAEVVEIRSRLAPDVDEAIAVSLRIIMNLLSLIDEPGIGETAAATPAELRKGFGETR